MPAIIVRRLSESMQRMRITQLVLLITAVRPFTVDRSGALATKKNSPIARLLSVRWCSDVHCLLFLCSVSYCFLNLDD